MLASRGPASGATMGDMTVTEVLSYLTWLTIQGPR